MRGPFTHAAEIARSPDDALAEVSLPDAIHHHTRSQRIFGVGDGFGELTPSAPLLERDRLCVAQHGEKSARSLFSQVLRLPALLYTQTLRRGEIFDRVGERV